MYSNDQMQIIKIIGLIGCKWLYAISILTYTQKALRGLER